MRIFATTFLAMLFVTLCDGACAQDATAVLTIDADTLEDKIRGGMLGQVIGNLNGLPHEFKYIDKPGNVEHYTPSLPDGAHTDDDTDIEWVYLREIARSGETMLPPKRIAELWKAHINRRIWCANRYARDLVELGFEPPWTGNVALNPWSEFNISGQFVCESFGLMAPAMPQTAARIGLNYTRVAIDGEPAQATQLFTTMISTAFTEENIDDLLDAGVAAVDPQSRIAMVVREVRKMHATNRDDWRATRAEIKKRWQTHGGVVRDRNGYELNTACTVAALLHGKKDFVETLRIAFNMGWDCDNNAATAATIIGVIKGRRWMNEQDWSIADVYRNTTRDDMPNDETLTGLEETLIQCARLAIESQGGKLSEDGGRSVYRIRTQNPASIERLATSDEQVARVKKAFSANLERDLASSGASQARAAYVAICLGEADRLQQDSPTELQAAVAELAKYPGLIESLYKAPEPHGNRLRDQAERVGLRPGAHSQKRN